MRAFVFDHAELLSMDDETLDLLIRLLMPELILKLDRVISSEEFQNYKNDEMLEDSVFNLEKKLERLIKPVSFAEKLKEKPFPNSDMNYFQAFGSEFKVLFDKVNLFGMSIEELDEIASELKAFIDILPFLPANYKSGRKADFEEFCKDIRQKVIPRSIFLNTKKGIPYNKNIMKELKNNKTVLYDKNAFTRPSGYSYIAGKSEILRIVLEGYKWNIYIRKNNIPDETKYDFIL